MLTAQLFGYEDLAVILGTLLPFDGRAMDYVVASGLVITELLSLPYLLRMYISRLMRIVSAAAAAIVAGFWLLTSLTGAHALNSGLFSTTLELPGGLLAVFWSLVLSGLIAPVIVADSRFRHDASS